MVPLFSPIRRKGTRETCGSVQLIVKLPEAKLCVFFSFVVVKPIQYHPDRLDMEKQSGKKSANW